MLVYLSLDIICSSQLTVFLELHSRKTVRFSEQIMSADKYPSIFSYQMVTIVYIAKGCDQSRNTRLDLVFVLQIFTRQTKFVDVVFRSQFPSLLTTNKKHFSFLGLTNQQMLVKSSCVPSLPYQGTEENRNYQLISCSCLGMIKRFLGSRRACKLVCTPYLDFGGNLFCQNRLINPRKPIRSHFHSNKIF